MRTLFVSLLLIVAISAAVVGIVFQSQKPEKKAETFADLRTEFMKAKEKAQDSPAIKQAQEELDAAKKAMRAAKSPEEAKAARERAIKASVSQAALESEASKPINHEYALKFLQFSESHKDDPSALESLAYSLHTSGGPFEGKSTWNAAMKVIREHYVKRADIKKMFPTLVELDDDAAQSVMREVIAKNPDRKIQGKACKALADGLTELSSLGERLKKKEINPDQFAKETSKEYVARLIDRADANTKEAEALRKTLRDKYSDVIPDLSIGRAAPEIISQGLDGKPTKLSDLKGKVVVLDFWATWCGPCRGMIPHSREMVERLKDKPFALVSISADEHKQDLVDFLEKEKMPWTHWWSGEAGVVEDWDIDHFPTIFVLDAKGVIRFKEIRGQELEDAVNELLKEMEKSSAQ